MPGSCSHNPIRHTILQAYSKHSCDVLLQIHFEVEVIIGCYLDAILSLNNNVIM